MRTFRNGFSGGAGQRSKGRFDSVDHVLGQADEALGKSEQQGQDQGRSQSHPEDQYPPEDDEMGEHGSRLQDAEDDLSQVSKIFEITSHVFRCLICVTCENK